MARVSVDMSKKSTFRGPSVPDGTYTCEILSIDEGESSRSKSPQLNVRLGVVEPEEYSGSTLQDFISLSENSMFRRADFFWALGVEEEGEVEIDTDSFSHYDSDGNEIQEQGALVQVTKQTSKEKGQDGVERNRIRLFYNRIETEEKAEEKAPAAKSAAPKPAVKKAAPSGKRTVKV